MALSTVLASTKLALNFLKVFFPPPFFFLLAKKSAAVASADDVAELIMPFFVRGVVSVKFQFRSP
jgi:hypothetical protein